MTEIDKLDRHVKRDHRILTVYLRARRLYEEEARSHHNFEHVARDLYRALHIAAEEETVNFSVLVPAVLLHDIGFLHPDFHRLGHDVTGALLAVDLLAEAGYHGEERDAILHCIRSHKGKAETPGTLEAKILYDADVLEKAGLSYLLLGGKIICEFEETMENFLTRETADRTSEVKRGFFTQKAREMDSGRLARTKDFLAEIQTEILVDRTDYQAGEADLWTNSPPTSGSES